MGNMRKHRKEEEETSRTCTAIISQLLNNGGTYQASFQLGIYLLQIPPFVCKTALISNKIQDMFTPART